MRKYRILRWLGPLTHQPRLWHVTRRGVASGLAIGVFFGLLVPIAQIPLAVIAAVLSRAYVPAAVGSTLVTNPITFAPVYYAAYHVGAWLLGRHGTASDAELVMVEEQALTGLALWVDRFATIGAPLALGLLTLAAVISVSFYFAVHWIWRLKIVREWNRRKTKRNRPLR